MMDVDVNVKHSLVNSKNQEKMRNENKIDFKDCILKQFEDSQHAIIDIAEPGSFWLFCVMQATWPIQCDVHFFVSQQICTSLKNY